MGRFVLGFLIGSGIGAGVVMLVVGKSGAETRQQFAERVQRALEVGEQAATSHEQELWARFREQMETQQQQPSPRPPMNRPPDAAGWDTR